MAYRTFRVNESGDLDLTGGRATLIDEDEAIAQTVRSYLRTFLGEWYLARKTMGVPWWEDVLVKAPSAALLEQVFRTAITRRPGVRALEKLDLSLNDERVLEVTYVIRTRTGELSRTVPLDL